VVLEVLRQTIGRVTYGDAGQPLRKEWALLSVGHFTLACGMSRTQAEVGIKTAREKGYITRRKVGAQRFEYAIRWKGTN
jgi:hypothetical protein